MKAYLILVDRADHEVGIEEKMVVHQQGLLHRAFSIFNYRRTDNVIELLLQKRSPHKYHSGGLWSNTCCGHPSPSRDIIMSAQQRLFEEMGIRNVPLHKAGVFTYKARLNEGLSENEIDHVFVGQDNGEPFTINRDEACDFKWSPLPDVIRDLRHTPRQFTAWFPKALAIARTAVED